MHVALLAPAHAPLSSTGPIHPTPLTPLHLPLPIGNENAHELFLHKLFEHPHGVQARLKISSKPSTKPLCFVEGILKVKIENFKRDLIFFYLWALRVGVRDVPAKFPGDPRFPPSKPRKTTFRVRARTLRQPPLRAEDSPPLRSPDPKS